MIVVVTTNVSNQLGDKWLPLTIEGFFTPRRAADMWFGDEAPPTIQDELASPLVTQAKAMLGLSILRQLANGQQRREIGAKRHRLQAARARMGKRRR